MDSRVNLTLALVTAISYDDDHGIFADVKFQPGGEPETALLGAPYAGARFGAYFPIEVDDIVLVALPMGDPGNGPVIIARMWSAADKPSADFRQGTSGMEASKDVVLRTKPGQKLKIRTSNDGDGVDITVEGNGDVLIQATGSGKVKLGGTDALEPAVLGDTLDRFLNQVKTWLDSHTHILTIAAMAGAGGTGTAAPPTPSSPSVPDIKADEVELK